MYVGSYVLTFRDYLSGAIFNDEDSAGTEDGTGILSRNDGFVAVFLRSGIGRYRS